MLSDNKCAAEMGVMPLLRLLPMIVIAPFCSRSQQYKLAFLCLSLYFYNFKIQFLLSVNLTFEQYCEFLSESFCIFGSGLSNSFELIYESFSDVGESRVWWRADFQSGSRVLKKVF